MFDLLRHRKFHAFHGIWYDQTLTPRLAHLPGEVVAHGRRAAGGFSSIRTGWFGRTPVLRQAGAHYGVKHPGPLAGLR
jgi:hypothetical protein